MPNALLRRATGAVLAAAAGLAGFTLSTPAAVAADSCAAFPSPVYRSIQSTRSAQLLTPWQSESQNAAAKYGFTDDRGSLGYGSTRSVAGSVAVARLYNSKTGDFRWTTGGSDLTAAQATGYTVSKTADFYAPAAASTCTVPVRRYTKGVHTRNATTATEQKSLVAAGWADAGVSFYLNKSAAATAPSSGGTTTGANSSGTTANGTTSTPATSSTSDDTFSIAVIPDTQTEVHSDSNPLFGNRTGWLVENRTALDLRYVAQTGDLTDWGWVDAPEITRAQAAMAKLTKAGLPVSIAVGNHDTRAVGWDGITGSSGYGGSAYMYNPECPTRLSAAECKSWLLVRKTTEINTAFPVSTLKNLGGVFEAGKMDNNWTTFEANNTKWMVLTLELWPRKTAVAWAKEVVATHPDYNVLIQTHAYLDAAGAISTSNGGYGETAPSYLYDQIVSKYSNVKMVFSGHNGGFGNRTDTNNGNTVLSFLGNDLGKTVNPVRIITINTKTGTVTSTIKIPTNSTTAGTTTGTITITR